MNTVLIHTSAGQIEFYTSLKQQTAFQGIRTIALRSVHDTAEHVRPRTPTNQCEPAGIEHHQSSSSGILDADERARASRTHTRTY